MVLTILEKKVIENLENSSLEYNENKYSCLQDISEQTNICTNELRGVFSSLIKKDLISIQKVVAGCPPFIFLTKK